MKIKNKKYPILISIFFFILIIFYNTSYKTKKENSLNLNKEIDKFNLVTHNNKNFNNKYFSGYASLLFFGFLNCPDICPMTLSKISKIIEKYDFNSDKVRFYFITVDPERDDKQSIKEYLSYFNAKIIGVTGDKEGIKNFLKHSYFKIPPPKSLDRFSFIISYKDLIKKNFSSYDIMATLLEFTSESIVYGLNFLPEKVNSMLVTGGGYKNLHLMQNLSKKLKLKFLNEKDLKLRFDFIESELVAYLTARSIYNLPSTFPSTTGVSKPLSGGKLFKFYKKPC